MAEKVSVIDFGARGDGSADSGEAFQRALDAGASTVEIPAGHYVIGRPLRIGSNTRLEAHSDAVVKLADGVATKPTDYLLSNANPEFGDQNIVIEGGTWDGNNAANPRPEGLFDFGCSGAMMHFYAVRGLTMRNVHLRNAEAYYVRLTVTRSFTFEDITFSSDRIRQNNDGIHLGGFCEDGVIKRIRAVGDGVTGDDLIAVNADDATRRTEVRGMLCGPIRNVRIENLSAEGCHTFVRLLSVWSPIENIEIKGIEGACQVSAINADAARGCRVPLFDEKNPPFSDGVGLLRNIHASGLKVGKKPNNGVPLLRLQTRIENFKVEDFVRTDQESVPTGVLVHMPIRQLMVDGKTVASDISGLDGERVLVEGAAFRSFELNC